jgi:hypothetical protein
MRRSLGALKLAAALIAGCASQPVTPAPSAEPVATTPATAVTLPPASQSPTAPPLAPSGPPPPSAAPPSASPVGFATPCMSDQLQTSVVDTGGGLGTVEGWLRFVNTGATPCRLSGWPTLVGVTASGGTTVARRSNVLLALPPDAGVPTVTLAPGDTAVAAFAAGDNPVGSAAACPPSYRVLRVTPPGTTNAVSLSAWNYWLGADLSACVGIEVTTVVAESTQPDLLPYRP